jgi:hypothetical protein
VAWKRRDEFAARPYFHWFIYLPLTAVGLHQFEEYGWPGGFRNAYVGVFPFAAADALVPSLLVLELFNSFGLMLLFALLGWLGTRITWITWIGLELLFINFGNGFFHLIYSVVRQAYLPGAVTGTLLYLPLALLATRFAVRRDALDATRLLLAFAAGTAASFLPIIHIWLAHGPWTAIELRLKARPCPNSHERSRSTSKTVSR